MYTDGAYDRAVLAMKTLRDCDAIQLAGCHVIVNLASDLGVRRMLIAHAAHGLVAKAIARHTCPQLHAVACKALGWLALEQGASK